MPKNIFRVFNPNARPEDRAEKRRAQLRNAQQTYRERKDRYTKALEQELAVSRAREAHLFQENTRLKETIQALKQGHHASATTHAHAAHAHTHTHGTTSTSTRPDGINVSANEFVAFDFDLSAGSSAGLSWPDFDSVSNSLCSTPQMSQVTQALAASLSPTGSTAASTASVSASVSASAASSASPSASSPCRIGDVDPTDIGMQFVLTLEEPCLDHIHTPGTEIEANNVSNNHALTVTSRLADMGFTDDHEKVYKMQQEARETRMIMQSMLDLSKDLVVPHSGSLTPVQAWQSVCSQPQFASLPVSTVQALAESLRGLVQCHGFGAVIEQDACTDQIIRAFASAARAKHI